ncbi:glycosyl transferase family group 2-domain-containing protein [Leptodontidium sp. MPI-SDFR-AT-0119]|nr:glycosyl transferase family group 2-domain-containing protein [Leptodontidium sp. MPI-SDFR-AT-0119]
MGFMSYFQTSTKAAASKPSAVNEKYPLSVVTTAPNFSGSLPGKLAPPQSDIGSISPAPSSRAAQEDRLVDEIKHQVVVNHLFQHQCSSLWIRDVAEQQEGVMVRKRRNDYIFKPPGLAKSSFAQAMTMLNVQSAMTVSSGVIEPFLDWSADAIDVPLLNGLRIQILPTFEDLYQAKRHQYAAFIASEALLVVWDDEPTNLLQRAKTIEAELLKFVWKTANATQIEKEELEAADLMVDEETGLMASKERPILLYNCFLVACSLCLLTVLIGLGYVKIADELVELQQWVSLAFLVMTPVNAFLTLFFSSVIISAIAQIIGPIQHLTQNSKYFSATPPMRLRTNILPHVTIQCPVYKEGLDSVILPTVRSIKRAISTYELQGGSANIFINDDGLQIISAEERQARIEFYADNQIGWTARPGHNSEGFIRKGKFKKASNMNYGLTISNSVEEALQQIDRPADWSAFDESIAYERCLKAVLAKEGRAWADGNIRIGDYILIIDSDTRVPEDCLLDAASEMEQSPRVAIIQFSSGVMQVANDYFENGVTFFTNLIYTAIRFGVASGDVAPFVGHNAILRWSALQEVAFKDEEGVEKYWSESHVSEDFDIALRLQVYGYVVRMAAWAGDGFKEGVSLTVYDELTRWEKYAYGCSELVFHPVKYWLTKGPITPLFRRFLWSGMPIGSKINIISYIGTYYAIGAAWIMTFSNYIAVGLFNGSLDKWYVESWQIWISIIMVFTVAGNVSLAVQRHRTSEKNFLYSLFENFKWCLMFVLFFGGMSLHISQALLCHMFSIDMSWGATSKEVEFSNFFIEIPKVFKSFKYSIALSLTVIAGMVIMAVGDFIPWSWNIDQFVAIFPLAMLCACHLLLPVALNPGLMTFSW